MRFAAFSHHFGPSPSGAAALLTLSAALLGAAQAQQTQPAQARPAQAQPAQAPAGKPPVSAQTDRQISALAVSVGKVATGRLVACPAGLRLSPNAVCLYSPVAAGGLRPLIRGAVSAEGDWKTSGQAAALAVKQGSATPNAYVLLVPLSAKESLLVMDRAGASSPAPSVPAGVVKGQPYLLGRDLAGVVNVVSLGGGKFRLNVPGEAPLTVTVGQKSAQRANGTVDLPLAPASDGKNLIFPLSGLRALGCTVTDAPRGVTVACGSDSVSVLPIVF